MSEQIFAAVVNWNRPEDTLRCLRSLKESRPVAPQVIVVDNGSSDDSADQISAGFPDATLVRNAHNLGFARGYNQAIRMALEAGAGYILVINNDAFLKQDALADLLEVLEDPAVGVAAPAIYFAGEPETIWSIGGRFRPLIWEVTQDAYRERDAGQLPPRLEQDFITGCCFLAPRATLEQTGLFDERFRVYYEDFDFSQRVRFAGKKIVVSTAAKAWHNVASSSGGRDSPNERYWMARSSVTFYRKHLRGLSWLPVVFWRLGSALRTSLRLTRSGKTAARQAYWRGLWDGWALPPEAPPTRPTGDA